MANIYQNNPFVINQPQQEQQGMGMNPMQGLNMYQQFTGQGGGGLLGGGGSIGAANSSAGLSGAGGAGSSAAGSAVGGSSGSSFGSMASSAGPWVALAAVIAANENEARAGGYRQEDSTKYAMDLLGGKVGEQDFQKRWLPMMFGENLKNDKYGFGGDMAGAMDIATLDFSNAADNFKEGTLGKLLGGIGDLFS